jgi:hypothetical protein
MMDLKHSNEKNVCIIYGQEASKVPLPSHLMPFCLLLLSSTSRELSHLADEIHIMKIIWTSSQKFLLTLHIINANF